MPPRVRAQVWPVAAALWAALAVQAHAAALELVTYDGPWGDAVAAVAGTAPVAGGVAVRRYGGSLAAPAIEGADLADAPAGAAAFACDEGLAHLLPAEPALTVPGGAAVPGAIQDCGAGYMVTSLVLASAPGGPADWDAFFAPDAEGGARALPRGPRGTLELAAMADGLAPGDVYASLATAEGTARAYARLDALAAAPGLVFWDDADDALGMLAAGRAAAAAVPSPHAARAIMAGAPLVLDFDRQLYRIQRLVLLAARPDRQAAALAAIRHMLLPERQAALARATLAGPVSRLAYLHLPAAHAALLPTAPAHGIATRGLAANADFWRRHGARLAARHADWLARVEADAQPR